MEYSARLRYARISARKMRLVADLIRGKNVNQALDDLHFSNRRGAVFLQKLLRSAVANASQNPDVNVEQLYINLIMVGDGPILKRFKAAAMGRAAPIQKRTSHVTIGLTEHKKAKTAPVKKGKARKVETPKDKAAMAGAEKKKVKPVEPAAKKAAPAKPASDKSSSKAKKSK